MREPGRHSIERLGHCPLLSVLNFVVKRRLIEADTSASVPFTETSPEPCHDERRLVICAQKAEESPLFEAVMTRGRVRRAGELLVAAS